MASTRQQGAKYMFFIDLDGETLNVNRRLQAALTPPIAFDSIHPAVAKSNSNNERHDRRLLVSQVAKSVYLSRSSRLRDMFIYVCGRVLDDSAGEIHEQEVGQEVFGRPPDYDTAADNTVRVHASMLRKRVNQYFENEGSLESLIIEIPRGNYAPVFRERPAKLPEPDPPFAASPVPTPLAQKPSTVPLWLASALALIFAALSLGLFVHSRNLAKALAPATLSPAVGEIWAQVFPKGKQTDLVLGDASLGVLQERIDRPVSLTEYFDRSYLSDLDARTTSAKLDSNFAKALLLKRQVNYGDVALLARMTDMAHSVQSDTRIHFARDYSFRDLKANNSVLFGNVSLNPWIEPFENRLTLRWKFDADTGVYYPVNTTAKLADQEKFHAAALPDGSHEGFASLSLLPNLSGSGDVLILSATGGTAMNALLDFLCDEGSIRQLRAQLAPKAPLTDNIPYFEALIRVSGRNSLPRNSSLIFVRRIGS